MGITASIDISAEQRQILLDLLSKYLANAQVWAFGSRVKWTTRSNSDLDLVVFSSPEQDSQVSALKEALEESNLPFRVDLLVWDKLPENFQRNIEEGYVVLVEGDDVGLGEIMNFESTTLGEYAKVQGGYAYKSEDFSDSGKYPVLKIKNVRFGNVDYSKASFISEKKAHETIDWKTKDGDILISMTGSGPNAPESLVGRVARVWADEPEAWINQRVGRLVLKEDGGIHPDFLFYLLSSPRSQDFLVSNSSGSANQANISGKTIESLSCPKVDYQQSAEIAKILRELDQKILINRQTNQTLEQIALALFKSWFVDFEPVKAKIAAKQAGANAEQIEQAALCAISGKTPEQLAQLNPQILQQLKTTAALFPDALVDSELGEIPEGWDITVLGELLEFNPKHTLKSGTLAPYLDMKNVPIQGHLVDEVCLREMASGTKFINGDTLLARITPCLENGKTAYVDFLEKDQIGWGSTEFIVLRPRNGRPTSLGYIIARLDTFRAKAIQTMTGTSGRQRASAQAIAEQLWINYPIELLNIYDLVAGCHLKKAKSNGDENNILSKLRDSLLPKLLSGELDLSNWDELTVFNRDVGTGRDLSLRLNSPNVE